MKKTLTINLGGIVFHIDDDAFVNLRNYLDTIRGYFDTSEGRDEIMTDIESRIAEMLQEKMHGSKEVINSVDIQEVIVIMGQPEDYISEDPDEAAQPKQEKTTYTQKTKRRLYRDMESNVIGGVSSGVGYYFGIDPIWIRLIFIIAVFAGFSGALVYIILWVIMPEARTSSEKLAMKGEPVTFDNIGKTVEEEIDNLKKKLNNLDDGHVRRYKNGFHKALATTFDFIGNLLKLTLNVIGKILGFFFIFFGGIALIGLIVLTLMPINNIFIDSNDSTIAYSFMEFSNIFFSSSSNYWMSSIGGILMVGIPLLALLLAGLTMMFNVRYPKYTGLAMAGTWLLGMLLFAIGGVSTSVDFGKKGTVTEVITIPQQTSDTLIFKLKDHNKSISYHKNRQGIFEQFEIKDGILTTDGVKVDVLRANGSTPKLEIIKSARGNSFEKAEERATKISFNLQQDSNMILLDPFYNFQTSDKWRNQEIEVNLYLPINSTVFIPKNFKYLLDDVKNYSNTYDHHMAGHYWTMTDSGLVSPEFMNQRENDQIRINIDERLEQIELSITDGDEEHSIVIK